MKPTCLRGTLLSNQTCPVFKIVNCVPRFSVTVGLKRLMKIYGVKPN